jgi:DNA-binding transcriptional regulator YhcF (GntR family)
MKKLTVNCTTGESVYEDLTPEEIAVAEAAYVTSEEQRAERESAMAAAEAARESARTKLAALGLTEAEIAALVK